MTLAELLGWRSAVTPGRVGTGLPRTYRLGAPWYRWISRR